MALTTLLPIILVATSFGQTNAPAPDRPANRYLLIVETSKAMQPRADAVLGVVGSLVDSGFNGQARAGDSLGVWTYNDQLHAGEFALQTLLRTNRMVAKSVVGFLRTRKYEKTAHLENVLPQVQRLVKNSDFITIILISDGTQNLEGTPFDDRINKAYRSWEKQQTKAKMPIVTVLRAKKGEMTHYAVSPVPWPLEMPPLPEELKLAATPKPPAPEPPKPVPMAAPLIVTGKKPAPVEPAPPATQPSAVTTGDPAQGSTSPPPTVQTQTATSDRDMNRMTVPAVTPPPVKNEPTPEKTADDPKPTTAGALAEPSPQPPPAASPKAVATPAPSEPAAAAPSAAKAEPTPAPPVSDAAGVAAGAQSPATAPAPSPSSVQPASPVNPAAVQAADAVPPQGLFSGKGIWLVGIVLLVLAVASWFWLRQRARTVPHESLITRSFDRDKH